jgi:hypothetical protein
MRQMGKVLIATFNQLLSDDRSYHLEFIGKYEKIEKARG